MEEALSIKEAKRLYDREYYLKNKEKRTRQNREWYKNNKEHKIEVERIWRKTRPERCDIPNEKHLEKTGKRLSIHHIDGNHYNNDEKNCMTVCCACHQIIEPRRKTR